MLDSSSDEDDMADNTAQEARVELALAQMGLNSANLERSWIGSSDSITSSVASFPAPSLEASSIENLAFTDEEEEAPALGHPSRAAPKQADVRTRSSLDKRGRSCLCLSSFDDHVPCRRKAEASD